MHVLILSNSLLSEHCCFIKPLEKLDPLKWCCCSFKAMWNLIFQILFFFRTSMSSQFACGDATTRKTRGLFSVLGLNPLKVYGLKKR